MAEIEFFQSKSGHWVPVAEKKALHSSVDPIREAEKLVQDELERLAQVRTVIVMGLGGGYHIEEIQSSLGNQIVVIEANRDLAARLQEKRPEVFECGTIIAGQSPSSLLREDAILDAFSGSFGFFNHAASLRLNTEYYNSVKKIFCARNIETLKACSARNAELQTFLGSLDVPNGKSLSLPQMEEAILNRNAEYDNATMLWLALRELVK